MGRFEDKVVVITGAAGGIGSEAAKQFAQEGAKLVLVDLKEDQLQDTVEKLDLKEGDYLLVPADVSNQEAVQNYVNRSVDTFGKIDVFFNNAGVGGAIVPTADYPVDAFDTVINVNLRGAFLGLKYVLQVMEKQGYGSIINTSSIGGLKAMPNTAAYNASKFAIVGLTGTAAIEYASKNIRINAVGPSPANTQMMRKTEARTNSENPEEARKLFAESIPLGRYAETSDVVNAVLFLASEESSFITGVTLPVDGGMSA
ncbi:SDR family NAD(P)-dependent oxidoreductase [Neobacillus sp. YIM B06451]|uniref:SDR family NAD(P)-dependent oxidoreductase n=1 Tax=Neobacillus sp. YIM B06451 TaxID=3070994 RepID=UPI002931135C|nr:SDR family NAD(P)-dependent oxidoreductase [Neobacillus sp. YIM B06451]